MSKVNAPIVVRGLDLGASFLSALVKGARKRGVSDEGFYDFVKDNASIEKLVDVIAEASTGFRFTDELAIRIPALPRPTLAELREKFSFIKSIERDTSPEDAVTLRLGTILRPNEERVNGAEYERRIAPRQDIILGYQQAIWLVEHQDEFPSLMALLLKVYIDFSGLVLVSVDGHRDVPCLDQYDERWCLNWIWIAHVFYQYGRLASSSK